VVVLAAALLVALSASACSGGNSEGESTPDDPDLYYPCGAERPTPGLVTLVSLEDGTARWEAETPVGATRASTFDGLVVIYETMSNLVVLELETGSPLDVEVGERDVFAASPEGDLDLRRRQSRHRLAALDPVTGERLWRRDFEGRLLSGSFQPGDLVIVTTESRTNPETMRVLAADTGEVLWSLELTEQRLAAAAVTPRGLLLLQTNEGAECS
jgi:outer membrane protein assembly factor BamB